MQHLKVLPHDVIRNEIANALVEFSRTFQVGEQERQAGDLQPLVHVKRVGAIDIAERLVGEEPLGGEEWLALAKEFMQRVASDPHARKHTPVSAVFERKP